jgi:hypothetical protein
MGGVVSGIVGGIGGLVSGGAASRAAESAAAAQRDAANRASQMAQFRPVGITTGFGSSRFNVNDLGQVTEAGYTLDPQLQAIRDRLLSGAGAYDFDISRQISPFASTVQGLFGLGGQLLPTDISRTASPEALALQQRYQQAATGLAPTDLSMAASPEAMALSQQLRGLSQQVTPTSYDPTAAAQQYFDQQRALLEPSRQAQLSQTRSRLFGTGRGGLGVTTATGGAPTSPELQAYYNAIAQQDAALAAQSTDVARSRLSQDIALGTQLGGAALSTQQQAENLARERTLGNLAASLGYGGQAIATGLAGEDVARQRFAQDLGLGTGLFGTAGQFLGQIPALQTAYLDPLRAQLGLASTVEGLGQQPFALSQELAAAQSGAGRGAAAAYLQPQQAAAQAYAQYQGYSPMGTFLSGAGGAMGGGGGLGSLSGLFSGSQGGYNFGALGRQFGIPGQTSTGLYTFD